MSIYTSVHGTTPSPKRTSNSIEVDSHSIKWNGLDVRTRLSELYPSFIDYEFRGHSIIIYL